MTDDDLRTMLREFRASVAADLESQHRRIDAFIDETRRRVGETNERIRQIVESVDRVDERIRIAETSILNEIRAMTDRIERRFERLEGQ